MDINKELFKRNKPKKKLELIEMLTPSELLGIHPGTILRIVKEVGVLRYKSRDRELRLSNRTGNNWNSSVESIGVYKNRLFINIYIQMDHTDTTIIEEGQVFFRHGEYMGKAFETNRYGDKIPNYCQYSEQDKARCIRAILNQYVHSKYSEES